MQTFYKEIFGEEIYQKQELHFTDCQTIFNILRDERPLLTLQDFQSKLTSFDPKIGDKFTDNINYNATNNDSFA